MKHNINGLILIQCKVLLLIPCNNIMVFKNGYIFKDFLSVRPGIITLRKYCLVNCCCVYNILKQKDFLLHILGTKWKLIITLFRYRTETKQRDWVQETKKIKETIKQINPLTIQTGISFDIMSGSDPFKF